MSLNKRICFLFLVKALRIALPMLFLMLFTHNGFAKIPPVVRTAKAFISNSFNSELRQSRLNTNFSVIKNTQGDTLAFVFQLIPKGYVVLSPVTGLTPVIAFSTEADFDFNINEANHFLIFLKKDMTQRLSNYHQALIRGEDSLINLHIAQWNKLNINRLSPKGYGTQYGPHLASVWGGVNCYDFYSQPINVGNYYTPNNYSPGCVATGMAIVMHYYKWPKQGIGYHYDYDNQGSSQGTYYSNFGATTYLWGRMLDKYMGKVSQEKHREAMGRLSYDCAVSVNMNFEFSGSTSNLNRTPAALNNYFRFSGHYQDASWYSFWPRLRENLRNAYPVLMAISSTAGNGHVMVCDGYGFDSGQPTYYHLQFGWWGSYNGWYNIQGSWNASGYSIIDGAVFDILPDAEIGEPIRTTNENTFDLPLLTGKHLHWDSFKFYESRNGGNWVLLNGSYKDSIYHRTVSQNGNYRYKTQAKVNGTYYSNSISTVQEVLVKREDSALVSLEFDGDDSYFVKDNSFNDLDITKEYTLEAWVKIKQFHLVSILYRLYHLQK